MRYRTLSVLLAAVVVISTGVIFTGTSSARVRDCFDGDHTKRGIMRGDVNDDGDRDAAWITARKRDGRCRYFVKVNMGQEDDRKRLRGADRFTMRNFSHITAMVEVDLVPGKEIGVLYDQGANTSFMALMTIRNDNIRRIRVNGRGAPPDDLFSYGGGIAFLSGSDCAQNRPLGTIIYSTAEYDQNDNRYDVRRRRFATDGFSTEFDRTAEPTGRQRVRPGGMDRFEEFGPPFDRCPGRSRG